MATVGRSGGSESNLVTIRFCDHVCCESGIAFAIVQFPPKYLHAHQKGLDVGIGRGGKRMLVSQIRLVTVRIGVRVGCEGLHAENAKHGENDHK